MAQSITQQGHAKDMGRKGMGVNQLLDTTTFHCARSSETDNTIIFVGLFVSLMCDIMLRWKRTSAGVASSSVIRRRIPLGRLNDIGE